jgi:Putative beta-barrel porin 2
MSLQPPAGERAFLVGPVTLYPSIVLRDVGFDSNIYNAADVEKEDFTLTAQPRLRAAVPFGPAIATGSATVGFVYYATYKEEQSINRLFEGRLEWMPSRFRPFLAGSLNHTRERAQYEIDARVLRRDTGLSGGADLKLTGVTSLIASFTRTTYHYGDDEVFQGAVLADQLDRTTDVTGADVRYALTPLTTLSIDIELQRDRFDTVALRDADSVRLMPGVQFSPDAVISGHVALGFRQFTPRASALAGFRGLVGSANVSYTLLNATTFSVEATRDVMYSFEPATPYYVVTGGRLRLSQRIAGPYDLIALAGKDRLEYQGVAGLPVSGRVDRIDTIGGGIGFRISPSLGLAVIYDRTERVSNTRDRRAYERRRLFASATFGQ